MFCGGDGAVLGVVVDKYFQFIADLSVLGYVAARNQHFIRFSGSRQVCAEIHETAHDHGLIFSYFNHFRCVSLCKVSGFI